MSVCWLVHMYNIWKNLGQTVVNVMVELPLNLAQEISEQNEFVKVDKQLLAYALDETFEGILQVVLAAKIFSDEYFDELLDRMVLGLEISNV